MPELLLLGDDLSGTLDAAVAFAALPTRVACTVAGLSWAAEDHPAVLALNTESRHLPGSAAASAVSDALADAPLPPLLFKKIDSTLRGQVVAESLALLAASARRRLVVAPAVPDQGRTVADGVVRVHGVALGETDYARDLRSPAPAGPLPALYRAVREDLVIHTGSGFPLADTDIWIPDCKDGADLRRVADWCREHAADTLLVGAAGLAAALAGSLNLAPVACPPLPTPCWMVVGSQSPVSQRQADTLVAAGVPEWPARHGELAAGPDRAAVALIRVPPTPRGEPVAVLTALGASLAALCARHPPGTLVLTGGDTAAAVLGALGIQALALRGEPTPGMAVGEPLDRAGPWIVTKAGGFGARGCLRDLQGCLGL